MWMERRLPCQEETEQGRREPEQERAVVAVAKDRDRGAWEGTKPAPGLPGIASAHSVANACLIVWERLATR